MWYCLRQSCEHCWHPQVSTAARVLRQQTVTEVRNNPERYRDILVPESSSSDDASFEEEVDKMARRGTWTGQIDLTAFEEATGTPIRVSARPEHKKVARLYEPHFRITEQPAHVSFTGDHFDPIV